MQFTRFAAAILALGATLFAPAASAQYAEYKFDRSTAPDLDRNSSSTRVRAIVSYMIQKDCGGAVRVLKEGLKAKEVEVMLMAGTMYEDGMCVKQNWEQASGFYESAADAGNKWAQSKLVAGLVSHGDAGGALYWVHKLPRVLPGQCYSQVDPDKDADGFTADVNRWPQQRLQGCLYMAGVYHAIFGNMHYPDEAARIGVWGDVEMRFAPAAGTVDWTSTRHETRVLPGLQVVNPDTPLAHRGRPEKLLVSHARLVSDQALKRFARPEGISPDIVITSPYTFEYQ